MEDLLINFEGDQVTLWDFAGLDLDVNHNFRASIAENDKKRKMSKLFESIQDIEGELIKVVSDSPNFKEGIRKFLSIRHFGSFESMRVEMELKYKA